jgi:hypothetical protein
MLGQFRFPRLQFLGLQVPASVRRPQHNTSCCHKCFQIQLSVRISVCVCVCVCVCVRVRANVCSYPCLFVKLFVFIIVCSSKNLFVRFCVHTGVCSYKWLLVQLFAQANVCLHKYVSVYLLACASVCPYQRLRAIACVHKCLFGKIVGAYRMMSVQCSCVKVLVRTSVCSHGNHLFVREFVDTFFLFVQLCICTCSLVAGAAAPATKNQPGGEDHNTRPDIHVRLRMCRWLSFGSSVKIGTIQRS